MTLKLKQQEFIVERDEEKCIACQACVRQCPNDVHVYDPEKDRVTSDNTKCVGCPVCEIRCPTGAIRIKKSFLAPRIKISQRDKYLRSK